MLHMCADVYMYTSMHSLCKQYLVRLRNLQANQSGAWRSILHWCTSG